MSKKVQHAAFVCAIAVLAAGGLVHVAQADPAPQPNIVFVLVDDMSENLLPYMSEVSALAADGVTFPNYFNATPWCCPSRASTQTGNYPHTTNVRSNTYPGGSFLEFMKSDMNASIGVEMQANGYRTGLLGKYLNGYTTNGQTKRADLPMYPENFVPPGWNDWFGATAYQEFKYTAVESVDGGAAQRLAWSGAKPANYFTDVVSARAQSFIRAEHTEPFFLMVDTYAPHSGIGPDPQSKAIKFPAAPRDRAVSPDRPASWGKPEFPKGDCGPIACNLVPWPDPATSTNFNVVTTNPLSWAPQIQLTPQEVKTARSYHIQRIQQVQSVNDMLGGIRQTLADTGQADNTWIFFASDNGYHLGEHALIQGKTTAYDTDIKVPMIVRPPGGTGTPVTINSFAQNIDVLPTLVGLAGGTPAQAVEGVSLLPLLTDPSQPWRANVLLELTNPKSDDGDDTRQGRMHPDMTSPQFNPDTLGDEGSHVAPTYNAIRTAEYLYIDYSKVDGLPPTIDEAEFYDLTLDPGETNNIYGSVPVDFQLALDAELSTQVVCAAAECWAAQLEVPVLYPVGPTDTPTDSPTESPSDPPTTEPPTTEPPTTEPPTSEPPTSEPPTSEPPTSEPPTSEPPSSPPAP